MLHPDYQYTPKLIPAMASMIAFNEYDAVIASRMLNNGALKGGMPLYKFCANKFLTDACTYLLLRLFNRGKFHALQNISQRQVLYQFQALYKIWLWVLE